MNLPFVCLSLDSSASNPNQRKIQTDPTPSVTQILLALWVLNPDIYAYLLLGWLAQRSSLQLVQAGWRQVTQEAPSTLSVWPVALPPESVLG